MLVAGSVRGLHRGVPDPCNSTISDKCDGRVGLGRKACKAMYEVALTATCSQICHAARAES